MKQIRLTSALFEQYLYHLRRLVEFPSVSNQPSGIKKAVNYCRAVLEKNLGEYEVFTDESQNLIAVPENIDPEKNGTILSAHIDTVDANAEDWDPPYRPFIPFENSREIVARGVSDCKAGVAFQLFLAELAGRQSVQLHNLIFTITFKEEGAGDKTSATIGRFMDRYIPSGPVNIVLLVLENTVVNTRPAILNYYNRERGNFLIKISAPLTEIKAFLEKTPHWNPVSIRPVNAPCGGEWRHRRQSGKHMCRTPRSSNLLFRMLLAAKPHGLLMAGNEHDTGVCPERVSVSDAKSAVKHDVVLSNRSFDTMETVLNQLRGIAYRPIKDFSFSAGIDVRNKLTAGGLQRLVTSAGYKNLCIKPAYNTGCSDASIIFHNLPQHLKKRFIPIVVGPGTRSQPDAVPPRFTHGKNETFDKSAGHHAVNGLLRLLCNMACAGSITT